MSILWCSKKVTIVQVLSWCIVIAAVALSSCGGGGGGGGTNAPATCTCSTGTPFWAADFINNSLYCACATKVAEGLNSYIYVENSFNLTLADVTPLMDEFDTRIYPTDTANFGSEPNPGIDNDPKITILLLNIKDGFNPAGGVNSFTAGYFDSGNEYPLSANPYSNLREMFYMNINPAVLAAITPTEFYTTLAHEFQHMIHWEQKTHQKSLIDDTWLNEAMSEIAPTFLYGPSISRIFTYEKDPSNSLTTWNGDIYDYGIAYMWSQYYKDQFGGSIFKSMMTTTSTGITSVNQALAATFPGKTFDGTFNDLSIAILLGTLTLPGHLEWSYTSIDTAPGIYSNGTVTVTLPGLLPSTNLNPTTLPALGPWSIGFSWYAPLSLPTGTVTWTAASASQKATFIDDGGGTITTNITSGASYSYTTNGILIVTNPSNGSASSGGGVVSSAPSAMGPAMYQSPKQMLAAANVLSQAEGKPRSVCVHSAFTEREKEMRKKGFKPGF